MLPLLHLQPGQSSLYWHAHPDDVNDISRVGRQLVTDRNAALDGLHALINHNEDGVKVWTRYLYQKPV